ncbi:hypothetical protein [Acinetobacter phage Ab69]|nr:hypothetical protein [Acinetobacter phage Ab69]
MSLRVRAIANSITTAVNENTDAILKSVRRLYRIARRNTNSEICATRTNHSDSINGC